LDKIKYKIHQEEGANLFISIGDKPKIKKEIEREKKKISKGFILKILLSVIILIFFISSLIYFKNYINYTRESSILLSKIKKDYMRLSEEINLGSSSRYNYNQKTELTDSLIYQLNNFIYRFPDKSSEYDNIWPMVIVYKYVLDWYDHNYLNISNQKKPILIDPVQQEKINHLYPELSEIIQLLYDLQDYYHYKHRYVSEPEYSKYLLSESEVRQLLLKGQEIQNVFLKHSSLLDIKFTEISKFTRIVLNNYYPEIKRWDYFWKNYNKALKSEDEKEVSDIISKLRHDFPNLSVLDKGLKGDVSPFKNLTFGVFIDNKTPENSDILKKELNNLLDYISNTTDRTLMLKEYKSYGLLKKDFYNGSLDFSFITFDLLFNFAELRSAKPVVLRYYDDQPVVSYYLRPIDQDNGLEEIDLAELNNKSLIVDGSIFSDIFFEVVAFFDQKGINFIKFFKNVEFTQVNQESLHEHQYSGYDFIISTEEKLDKIFGGNKNTKLSTGKLLIDKTSSSTIFANRDTVDSLIIEQISNSLINTPKNINNAQFPNMNNWIRADQKKFRENQNKESYDIPFSQNMLVVDYKSGNNGRNNEIYSQFFKSLQENGFNLMYERNYNILKSYIEIQDIKIINFTLLENENKNIRYNIEVKIEDDVKYSNTGDLDNDITKVNFNDEINDICLKTGYQGEIIEVDKDKIKIYISISKLLSIKSKFNFFYYNETEYEQGSLIKIKKRNLGNGSFVSAEGNFTTVQISNVGGERGIKVGDMVDIIP